MQWYRLMHTYVKSLIFDQKLEFGTSNFLNYFGFRTKMKEFLKSRKKYFKLKIKIFVSKLHK